MFSVQFELDCVRRLIIHLVGTVFAQIIKPKILVSKFMILGILHLQIHMLRLSYVNGVDQNVLMLPNPTYLLGLQQIAF